MPMNQQRKKHSVKGSSNNHIFLTFYNLKNLLSHWRTFVKQDRFYMEPFRQKVSMASWSHFHHFCCTFIIFAGSVNCFNVKAFSEKPVLVFLWQLPLWKLTPIAWQHKCQCAFSELYLSCLGNNGGWWKYYFDFLSMPIQKMTFKDKLRNIHFNKNCVNHLLISPPLYTL